MSKYGPMYIHFNEVYLKNLSDQSNNPPPKNISPQTKNFILSLKKKQKKEKFLILTKETDFSRSKNKFLILF